MYLFATSMLIMSHRLSAFLQYLTVRTSANIAALKNELVLIKDYVSNEDEYILIKQLNVKTAAKQPRVRFA